MKRTLSVSLAILLLLSLALFVASCTDHDMATCYLCDQEFPKSEMDSGKLLDDIIYMCDDCLHRLPSQESSGENPGDDHDHGHDHDHDH